MLLLITACERRPLEVIVDEQVKVKVVVKWEVNFVSLYAISPTA